MSPSKFFEPPMEYGPVPFWFLCHHLEKTEMSFQVDEMCRQGVAGFFLHPRLGLQTPYGSEEWFDVIDHAIKEARHNGMKAWLYDEDPYPSGMAGGRVVWDAPQCKARILSVRTEEATGGKELRILFGAGRPIAAFAFPMNDAPLTPQTPCIDLTGQFGTIRDRECSAYWPRSYYPTIRFHPHSRSETSGPRLALHWTPPEGRWKVFAFVDEEYKDDGTFMTYADLLRPETVQHFIRLTHEQYAKRFGDEFDTLIPGIFTDEPKAMGFYPWTGAFLERFRELHGYDLRPLLPALCAEFGPSTAKVRCDYRSTVVRLLDENFFEPISRWCQEHRVRFTGHVSPEEDPLSQAYYLGNLMPLLKRFHVPGTDLIVPRVGDRGNAALNLGPKLVSSVAHQIGRERVLCETFACSGWHFTLADMRWITDWLYVLGVNMMVPHGFFYSIDSIRKIDAAPSLFFHQPWWPYFHQYACYVARLSYMLSGGQHVSDIAVLYPMRTMWALMPSREADAVVSRDLFIRITRTLLELHREFDYVDEDDLMVADVSENGLRVGHETYRVLILPQCRVISRSAIEQIERFVISGGTVVAFEPLPELTADAGLDPEWVERLQALLRSPDTHPSKPRGRALVLKDSTTLPVDLGRAIGRATPRDVEISSKISHDVFVLHRHRDGRHIYFVVNTSHRPAADLVMSCPALGQPQRWDPATGRRTALDASQADGRVQFSFPLPPRSSAFVVFDHSTEAALHQPAAWRRVKRVRLNGPWQMTREGPNVQPLVNWEIQVPSLSKKWQERPLERAFKLVPYSEPLHYLIFGPAPVADRMKPVRIRYRTRFRVKGNVASLLLVGEQGTVRGNATTRVNGRRVRPFALHRLYDPMTIATDLTKAVRSGRNTLEIDLLVDDPQGGLLEPLRLFGEFACASSDPAAQSIVAANNAQQVSAGSWTAQGLPFYSGTCRYETTLEIEPPADVRVFLRLPAVADLAEISVNGHQCGSLLWEPFELDITDWVTAGKNALCIRVSNTGANLVELSPKRSGLLKAPVVEFRQNIRLSNR